MLVSSAFFFAIRGCRSQGDAPQRTSVDPERPTEPEKPEPIEVKLPSPTERLASATTLAQAIGAARQAMSDEEMTLSPGAAMLAGWSAQRLTWADLQTIPETKRSLIMKDPEAERGKRLCASGTVVEIHAERTAGSVFYNGGLMTASGDVVRYIAVGSSGELVANSVARICGIVIGTFSYGNSGGGVTHAAQIVGMFDLPENRKGAGR